MYLDRIEITGFKSFADKTVIDFNKGVTAVVGPNGSGKSNLSEAIKWVLGEQSAKSLRGKKMDDIIFAGSQTRKRTNVAEVNLILNNEDKFLPLEFDEIQITRRFHRNGDSECFINKKPCRLKDIINLLMDSGLGKDSFSIISQGKVETIFHNKPEERRGMFEEVAGVLKYKTRKQEATRKLERTQEHLDRVEDILFEIKNQIEPLRKQKEKAEIYKEKKKALSHIDIALMVLEIDTIHQQSHILKMELNELENNHQLKQKELHTVEQLIHQKKVSLSKVQSDLKNNQEKYVELVRKVEQCKGQEQVLTQQLNFAKKDIKQQLETKIKQEQTIEQLTVEIKTLHQNRLSLLEQIEQLKKEEQILQKEKSYLDGNMDETLEIERNKYIDYLQQQAKIHNELVSVEKELNIVTNQLKAIQQNAHQFEENYVILQADVEKLSNELQEISNDIVQLTETYQIKANNHQQLVQDTRQLELSIQQIKQVLQQKRTRKSTLEELNEDYAGFFQGVKEILKNKNQLQGIHGALGEIFSVPKQYTTAIDTVLGGLLQNIVVNTQQDAVVAINFLKSKKLGRATFLPIDVIKPKRISSEILKSISNMTGFINVANQLITCQSQYQNIIANFLGTTIVVETLEDGVAISKKINNQYRIVSLKGDVIHAGGSLTGGSTRTSQTNSLLARRQELEELTIDLQKLLQQLDVQKKQLHEKSEQLDNVSNQLQDIQQLGAKQRLLEKEKELQLNQVKENVAILNQKKVSFEQERKQFIQSEQELKQKKVQLKNSLNEIDVIVLKSKETIEFLSSSQDEKNEKLQQLLPQLQQIATNRAIKKEQLSTIDKQLKEQENTLQIAKEVLEKVDVQQVDRLERDATLKQKLDTLQIELKQVVIEKETVETAIQQNEKEIDLLNGELYLDETKEKEYQQVIQKNIREIGQIETRLGKFDVVIDGHLSRLNEEYHLTYEAASAMEKLNITMQEASAQVNRLKKEIENLGNVNLDAIDEYTELSNRYDTMTEQQKDLLMAKEQLLATMINMDEEVVKRFSHTFYNIKKEFEKTFPKLFGGGRATLELTDPNNLLETGIDIIAQPPGKKLQNLNLLSGGEKAFTAIALLFSILKVKPVPFCLLDEVEAALDEANVSRYGKYLREFVNQTQFIVITHRKGTMEQADVLYGVTMQESGVSKLAAVKFETYHIDET